MTFDKDGVVLEVGQRVQMTGTVKLVNRGVVKIQWDHPEREVVGFVLSPGACSVVKP